MIGLILAGVVAATSFNLDCKGMLESTSYFEKKNEPYEYVYRINLGTKKWCDGECLMPRDFAEISDSLFVLEQKDVDTPRTREQSHNSINRVTGEQKIFTSSGEGAAMLLMSWEGRCQKQPFTGFPTSSRQF